MGDPNLRRNIEGCTGKRDILSLTGEPPFKVALDARIGERFPGVMRSDKDDPSIFSVLDSCTVVFAQNTDDSDA